jgi:hypothetical protein
MIKKSEIEMERAKIIKTSRTLIRLKHSLEADKELNDFLPDRLTEFDQSLQNGTLGIPTKLLLDILEG